MRLLLLGGTTEARELARALHDGAAGPMQVTLSLAGRTREPVPGPVGRRTGGFGGVDGLVRYLNAEKIDLLVDATHPFAATMSANAHGAAVRAGVPLVRLLRPAWSAGPGDRWKTVADVAGAAAQVQATARRVFLTIGTGEIARFEDCRTVFFLIRLIERPSVPLALPDHRLVLARGPFDTAGETRLMREHRIDTLVAKNSGGAATRAKLDAARALGVTVVMIDRPSVPADPHFETVPDALDWIVDKRRNSP